MKIREAVIGLALILAVAGTGYLGYRHVVHADEQCDICGRVVETHHQSTILLKNGKTEHTCCARCALHVGVNRADEVASVKVHDRSTMTGINAQDALYVEGSDDPGCIPASEGTSEGHPHEPGVEYDRKFDRCLPSLVAFSREPEAREFIAHHGGRLLTYKQALASINTK